MVLPHGRFDIYGSRSFKRRYSGTTEIIVVHCVIALYHYSNGMEILRLSATVDGFNLDQQSLKNTLDEGYHYDLQERLIEGLDEFVYENVLDKPRDRHKPLRIGMTAKIAGQTPGVKTR